MYTQYTILIIKKKITPEYSKSAALAFFFLGTQERVSKPMVNEPSVFEPLKFYCICFKVKELMELSQNLYKWPN